MRKKGTYEDTELIQVIQDANENEVNSLIEKKADVNQRGKYLTPPLVHAVPTPGIVKRLLEAKTDVHLSDMFHADALFYAVKEKNTKSINLLLDHKGDINNQNNVYHLSPLAKAVDLGSLEVVELLVNRKAKINQRNLRGISALTIAAKKGYTTIVQFLIKNNANIDYLDVFQQSALDYAQENKKTDVEKILKSIYLKRQMFAFVSGLHPRQGANSSVLLASKSSIWEKNVLKIIKTMLDETSSTMTIKKKLAVI